MFFIGFNDFWERMLFPLLLMYVNLTTNLPELQRRFLEDFGGGPCKGLIIEGEGHEFVATFGVNNRPI